MFPRNSKPTSLVEEYNTLRSKKVKFLHKEDNNSEEEKKSMKLWK